MSTNEPEPAAPGGSLTPLPRVEDLPVVDRGLDPDRVREAFDAYRRHTLQLQAQLRVLQAAGAGPVVQPTGHAVRMDALHLIRAAAEFADQLESDAQTASTAQIRRTEEEVRRRQGEIQGREGEVEKFRRHSEAQREEILGAAQAEARELLAKANLDASRELQEAEARGARLLEQSRHQATELTNSVRAEVEQTLEWARAQATSIMSRTQAAAEQLLSAAGLGAKQMGSVVEAILKSVEHETGAAGGPPQPIRPVETPPGDETAERPAPEAGAAEPHDERDEHDGGPADDTER